MSLSIPDIYPLLSCAGFMATTAVSDLLSPVLSTATYAFPKLGVLWSAAKVCKGSNSSQDHILIQKDRLAVLSKIEKLKNAAGIDRKVMTYASMKSDRTYTSFGGKYSFNSPIIEIPHFDLFRNNGFGNLGAERKTKQLEKDIWRFTDNETSFLILREFGHIKQNDALLKLGAKIAMAAAIAIHQFAAVTWTASISMFVVALIAYLLIDRIYEETLDQSAVDALSVHLVKERLGGEKEAIESTIQVLKKLQAQNIYCRDHSKMGKLLITSEGENLFRNSPTLANRIQRLEKRLLTIQKPIDLHQKYSEAMEGIRLFILSNRFLSYFLNGQLGAT